MPLRFYIVPKIGTGATTLDAIRPKYLANLGVELGAMDYGMENAYLVGAIVTAAQHATISANSDAIVIPQNLDTAVGASGLQAVRDRLEQLGIPGRWVTAQHTYRQVVGGVGRVFQFMQRFHGKLRRRFFDVGITLDTRMNQLTAAQRQALTDMAGQFAIDTSSVTGTTTVYQVLKLIADQMPAFRLMGEAF